MREVCAFNGCAKDYMNKRSLEIHVERKHNGKGVTEGDYRCPTCNVGFSQMKIMNRHNNGVHKKLYRMFSCSYTCNKCDLVGIMRDDRAVHASKCENYGLFFVFFNCEMMQPDGGGKCRYTTLNHSQMERHVIKHQEEQPPAIKRGKGSVFKCPHCAYSSGRSANLKRHMEHRCAKMAKNPVEWSCRRCDKKYTSKVTLKKHKCAAFHVPIIKDGKKAQLLKKVLLKRVVLSQTKKNSGMERIISAQGDIIQGKAVPLKKTRKNKKEMSDIVGTTKASYQHSFENFVIDEN